jgi:hypothetical protein
MRMPGDVTLQFAQIATEIQLSLDSPAMPVKHPVPRRAELRPQITVSQPA